MLGKSKETLDDDDDDDDADAHFSSSLPWQGVEGGRELE